MKKIASIGYLREDIGKDWPKEDRWWKMGSILATETGAVIWMQAIPLNALLVAKTEESPVPYLQGNLCVTVNDFSQRCGRIYTSQEDGPGKKTTYSLKFFAMPAIAFKDREGIHFRVEQDEDSKSS